MHYLSVSLENFRLGTLPYGCSSSHRTADAIIQVRARSPEYNDGMRILSVLLMVLALAIPQFGQVDALTQVKKIKIGSMGQSDEAERFRLLLDEALGKAGFATTTEANDTADAVMTGVLTVRTYPDRTTARATVVLKTPEGKRLWGGDFEPHTSFKSKDSVKLRATDVASALAKEAKKAH
jgi:hypothetical protein